MSEELNRAKLWNMLGEPGSQVGSSNEPRTTEEYGCVWNEKWIYYAEGSQEVERVVLWNRSDFQGLFRVKPDGSAEPELLPSS